MRYLVFLNLVAMFLVFFLNSRPLYSDEQPMNAAGVNSSTENSQPPDADINKFIRDFVYAHLHNDALAVYDEQLGVQRKTRLIRLHPEVRKEGYKYISCSDFMDFDSGELLDLDFEVASNEGQLFLVGIKVHKVNGVSRNPEEKPEQKAMPEAPSSEDEMQKNNTKERVLLNQVENFDAGSSSFNMEGGF